MCRAGAKRRIGRQLPAAVIRRCMQGEDQSHEARFIANRPLPRIRLWPRLVCRFAPGEFVDCGGGRPKRTAAPPLARRARHRYVSSNRVGSHPPSSSETGNAPTGALLVSGGEGGIVRPIPGPHPCAPCASGPACGCPNSLRANSSNRVDSHPASPSEKRNAPGGASLVSGGEGGIRTHGWLSPTPDFESGTFDHSATSPDGSRVGASRQVYAVARIETSLLRRTDATRCVSSAGFFPRQPQPGVDDCIRIQRQ